MLRLTASDPLFAEWNALLETFAAMKNPACHYDLAGCSGAEHEANVAELWNEIEKRYNELVR